MEMLELCHTMYPYILFYSLPDFGREVMEDARIAVGAVICVM
jgi:hypothetical protein